MPSYKVLEPGFFDGTMYSPSSPRRNVLHTDSPIKPVPSWLEVIKDEPVAKRNSRKAQSKIEADKAEADRKEIEMAAFTSPGIETL